MIAYQRQRLAAIKAGVGHAKTAARQERSPMLVRHPQQQQRLDRLVRDAVAGSAFYRDRFQGLLDDGPVDLTRLPVLEKSEMMEDYDGLVADQRLRRDELLGWIESAVRDRLYLGRYRVMTTSGSTGSKGLFVYDPDGWAAIVGQFLRFNSLAGIRPRLPRRCRIAAIGPPGWNHMSRQAAATMNVGLHRVLGLDVTAPVGQLVRRLNVFRPDVLHAYPGVAARLAEEQVAGRLAISPSVISTGSELRTPAMTARIHDAFGVSPFDLYASTEGLWACECEEHDGLHVFDDATIVENVDEGGGPVAPGQPGSRLLVTQLFNRVQPIIRLAIADSVALTDQECRCGRTGLRFTSIDGRTDDTLILPQTGGGTVLVQPLHFTVLARDPSVREFQVIYEPGCLRVAIVPMSTEDADCVSRIRHAVESALAGLGVVDTAVDVTRSTGLQREPGGKLRLVVNRAAAGARSSPMNPKSL